MDKTYEDMRIYISVLYRQFQIYINNNTKDLQISASEYIFLMEMYKNDNMSQEQLSKNLIIDKSATARAIKSLEEKEYIIRKKDDERKGNHMYNVLICDDQPDIVNALKIYLTPEGYNLFEAFTGTQAVEIAKNNDIHLILLDVMMPVMDGITATSKIREFSNAPIILLTAKSETEDKVLGLNVGADDYITKPFVPVEVLARVRSQLRRYAQLGSRPEEGSGSITIGGIVLDDRTKTVTVEGEPVSLTPTEYAILHLLMANPGKVFSTKVLYESVWQEAALGSEGAVAVHIRHLREKIEINPSEPRYLKVVWGQGYKMEGGK